MIGSYIRATDNRRKEIVWLVLALLAALGLALFLLVYAGAALGVRSREEAVMLFGLVAFLACTVVYFSTREREQRYLNQSLAESLQAAVRELKERVAPLDELAQSNYELKDAVNRLQGELEQTYLCTVRAFMRILDARDDYTALHGEQVAAIAVKIAERMGLDPKRVEVLKSLGPLHDIGKVGIPDHILRAEGPLAEDEVALWRQHTVVGETIVALLQPGAEARAMIRNHHERWDGGGYPDGFAGDSIPLLARIVSAADSYHAIISQRPYRGARKPGRAIREMQANAGTQFDPDIVGVLAQLESEGVLDVRGAQ